MPAYPAERKAAVLKKMLPPHNMCVAELSRQEGIAGVTLFAWRKQAKARGAAGPGDQKLTHNWSAEGKLPTLIGMADAAAKGLYPQQVKAWRAAVGKASRPLRINARLKLNAYWGDDSEDT